jgi:Animal haem peroxidase
MLPFNTGGLANFPPGEAFFVAGDIRANEQVGLPVLLGPNALRPYSGYQPRVNAGVENVFATAAYRLGHSLLSANLLPSAPTGLHLRRRHRRLGGRPRRRPPAGHHGGRDLLPHPERSVRAPARRRPLLARGLPAPGTSSASCGARTWRRSSAATPPSAARSRTTSSSPRARDKNLNPCFDERREGLVPSLGRSSDARVCTPFSRLGIARTDIDVQLKQGYKRSLGSCPDPSCAVMGWERARSLRVGFCFGQLSCTLPVFPRRRALLPLMCHLWSLPVP